MSQSNTSFIWLAVAFVVAAAAGYGVMAWYLQSQATAIADIDSYEECVEAGYPVMESYPEQCATPDGTTFTREVEDDPTLSDPPAERAVNLYYYNEENDRDADGNIQCSADGLVAVERTIPHSETPLQDAVNLLLIGNISDSEAADGITTEFPLDGLEFSGVTVDDDDVLVLHFTDPQFATTGGSCRTAILWHQIEATATQFDTVDAVRFAPEELFQP